VHTTTFVGNSFVPIRFIGLYNIYVYICVCGRICIFILYIECNTGNSVSPHYLTAFKTDVLFTCSHVPHTLVIIYMLHIYYYIPSVQNYVCVLFFLTSYQRFLMSRVGRSYMGLFLFFVVKREVFFKTIICVENSWLRIVRTAVWHKIKTTAEKKNTCLDFSYNYNIIVYVV